MNRVGFDVDARAEFLAAVDHYEECRQGLGRRFREAVETEIEHISRTPFRFRMLHPPFRRCLVPKFPYSIVFSIEPSFILVVAVAHAKRKPGYWHDRLEKYL